MPHLKKQGLRRDFQSRRRELEARARSRASTEIRSTIRRLEPYEQAKTLAAYWPLPAEVDIMALMSEALERGSRVVLPRVSRAEGRLVFCPFDGNPDLLLPGPFGIMQPQTEEIAAETIDLIIVPGLAFDLRCHRLGYGAGYYDRYLKTTAALSIGVSFDAQVIDILPISEHDVALNMVVTESRTIHSAGT